MHLGQGFLGDGLLELAVGDLDHAVYSLALAEEAVRVGEPWMGRVNLACHRVVPSTNQRATPTDTARAQSHSHSTVTVTARSQHGHSHSTVTVSNQRATPVVSTKTMAHSTPCAWKAYLTLLLILFSG